MSSGALCWGKGTEYAVELRHLSSQEVEHEKNHTGPSVFKRPKKIIKQSSKNIYQQFQ
jgi:hypothetical protein